MPDGFAEFEKFMDAWTRRDFVRRMGFGAAYAAFLAGGVGFLEACANAGQSSATPQVSPRKGGRLIGGSIADPKTFNPTLANDTASTYVTNLIHEPLLCYDDKGNQVARIATGPAKISSDGLTFTFTLRKDVKFTDGHPLTSDDVRFTYDLIFDPKYKAVKSQSRATWEEYVEKIDNPDPTTFVVKLKKVYAPFATGLGVGGGILPKHVLGSMTAEQINTADYNTNPTVTAGPFKFGEWKKGQQVTMVANDTYYRGRPYLDQWIYLVSGSTLDLVNKLKTGEVDVAGVDPSQADAMKTVDAVKLVAFPGFSYDYIAFNIRADKPNFSKYFTDKAVRQAMLYALDRPTIAKSIYFGYAEVANSPIPPLSWAYNKDAKPTYPFDKKKATDLLDAAGWKPGSDGIRAKGGVRLSFEVMTNAGNKVRENLVLALQQAWKDIGIDATPKFVDFNKVLVPALLDNRDYAVIMVGLSFGIDPDPSGSFHTRNIPSGNFNTPGWSNPEADKLMDDAVATYDQKKRKELYFKLQDIINADPTQPALYFATGPSGINKRVQGYVFSPFVSRSFYAKDVFVSDGK